jgi:hypothetical protein
MADISSLLKTSGLDLERTATDIFGTVVSDFSKGTLEPALRSITGVPAQPLPDRNAGGWYATSYAHSLANTNTRPKLKFLFKVEFLFRAEIINAYPSLKDNTFVFSIKSVDRPKVDFEYEEVNRYNFRTKVLKQIKHRELTMSFHDDVGNQVYEFFRTMMMVHSPITRRSATATHDIASQAATYSTGHGMLFTTDPTANTDFAHRGVINTEIGNAIQAIKITQIFLQPQNNSIQDSTKEVAFFFMNPRVVSFDLDDVSHESSDANVFTMQFDYDFMVMSDASALKKFDDSKSLAALPGAPSEPSPAIGASTSSSPGGGLGNKITGILSSVGGRAVQKITNETIGKALRKVPGLDGLASTVSGIAGSLASGGISSVSSSFQRLASSPTGLFGSANTQSPTSQSILTDSSTFGDDLVGLNTSNQSFPSVPRFTDLA